MIQKKTSCLWLLLLAGFLCGTVRAQSLTGNPYLLLQKTGTPNSVVFHEGEEIRYRLRGERNFRHGLIQGFGQNVIRFHYLEVPLSEIETIDISRKEYTRFHFRSSGTKVMIAGAAFLVLDWGNQQEVSPATLTISGSMIAAGFILRLLQKRKFTPGGRYRLEIIDLR